MILFMLYTIPKWVWVLGTLFAVFVIIFRNGETTTREVNTNQTRDEMYRNVENHFNQTGKPPTYKRKFRFGFHMGNDDEHVSVYDNKNKKR